MKRHLRRTAYLRAATKDCCRPETCAQNACILGRKVLGRLVSLAMLSCLMVGPVCGPDPGGDSARQLITGDEVSLTGKAIGPGGGQVVVSGSGGPLDGLSLEVPEGAYATARDFNISYSPVVGHALAGGGQPAAPLIAVENGGEYADEFMILKIPVRAAHDEIVIPFLYDKENDTLEGLTVLEQDNSSVTVATRHFSAVAVFRYARSYLEAAGAETGFLPGRDDWQFSNDGSYVSPGGHCSGMSLTAMYYFAQLRPLGNGTLFEHYGSSSLGAGRSTRGFTLDDDEGIKLCSIVNERIHAETDMKIFGIIDYQGRASRQASQFCACVAAMLETGRPQYLSLGRSGEASRHAVICWRTVNGTLLVADPNYPDAIRVISYDSQKQEFTFYGGYDNVLYVGASNAYRSGAIQTWFNRVDSGEIGSESYGFPEFRFKILELNQNNQEVSSAYVNTASSDYHEVNRPRIQIVVEGPPAFEQRVSVYRYGNPPVKLGSSLVLDLQEGENLIGLHIEGLAKWVDQSALGLSLPQQRWTWAGFQWINFKYTAAPVDSDGCSLAAVAGRWRRHYDSNCDGVVDYADDDENVLILNPDGTVSHSLFGVIQGRGWSITDGRISLWYPSSSMMSESAQLSPDCGSMSGGLTIYYNDVGGWSGKSCWSATRQ